MPAMSEAGKRRKAAGLPQLPKDVRALERAAQEPGEDGRQAYAELIRQNSLKKQEAIFEEVRNLLIASVPLTVANVIDIARGAKGRVSDQIAGAKLVLEWAGYQAPGTAGRGANLNEMPLDQLESALAATLDRVHQLRAIAGTSQVIEGAEHSVPNLGTEASDELAPPGSGAQAGPATPPAPPASEAAEGAGSPLPNSPQKPLF